MLLLTIFTNRLLFMITLAMNLDFLRSISGESGSFVDATGLRFSSSGFSRRVTTS